MKPARAKSKRGTLEERIKRLQAQMDAVKKRTELRNTIAKAKQDLKALSLSKK